MDLSWQSNVSAFNTLSSLVIAFLPRSKCVLISWLQSPSAVILEPQKIKSDTVSPSICHEVMKIQYFGHLMGRADSFERSWCWERFRAGGEGDDRGWDGWMASPTQWTWIWVSSGNWWWTWRPGVLRSMRLQRVGHDWAAELNWNEPKRLAHLDSVVLLCISYNNDSDDGFNDKK